MIKVYILYITVSIVTGVVDNGSLKQNKYDSLIFACKLYYANFYYDYMCTTIQIATGLYQTILNITHLKMKVKFLTQSIYFKSIILLYKIKNVT